MINTEVSWFFGLIFHCYFVVLYWQLCLINFISLLVNLCLVYRILRFRTCIIGNQRGKLFSNFRKNLLKIQYLLCYTLYFICATFRLLVARFEYSFWDQRSFANDVFSIRSKRTISEHLFKYSDLQKHESSCLIKWSFLVYISGTLWATKNIHTITWINFWRVFR